MDFSYRPLIENDALSASMLDQKWFGEYGITESQLLEYIRKNASDSLALFADNTFRGFATFETLNNGSLPRDYVGNIPKTSKVLFIQQFTTTTNHAKSDMSMDIELLKAIESKAVVLNCEEVWEALATTHPYSETSNAKFDAFGFYERNGYSYDRSNLIEWKPDPTINIPCYLFRKKLK